MSLIQTSKFGNCSVCKATDTSVRKRGKNLLCLSCCRKEDIEKQLGKQKEKRKVQTALSKLSKTPENKELVKKEQTKSQLLAEADILFSRFIRNRDANKSKQVMCICCGNFYNLEDTSDGEKVIQCMHFIKRSVYSLRYSEENCAAGCKWCNKDMNNNPNGKAYQQFKKSLIEDLGEQEVAEMEIAHRKINKLDTNQLKVVIELYS